MRAVYSALSIYRDSQNSDSAMRDSISVLSAKDPGVFTAAALGRIHHQRTGLQRHAGQPPGNDRHVLPVVEAIGPEIHVVSGNGSERGIVRRHAGKWKHRLGDIVARVGLNLTAKFLDPLVIRR